MYLDSSGEGGGSALTVRMARNIGRIIVMGRHVRRGFLAAAALAAVATGCSGHGSTVVKSSCPLAKPGISLNMTLPDSCQFVRTDTAANPNAHYLWGDYACVPKQVDWDPSGGDPSPTATGAAQGNRAFRQLTVMDGDNPDGDGERCELGKNSYTDGIASFQNPAGTFYNYHQDDRRATYASIRLPPNFPIGVDAWQSVLQMKQSGPSNGSDGTPMLSLKVYDHRFRLFHTPTDSEGPDTQLWSPNPGANPNAAPRPGVWYRIAIDAMYSQDPSVGWVKTYIDLNGDGDFADPQEQSPVFTGDALGGTLKTEPAPARDPNDPNDPGHGVDIGPPTGAPIPSHLRAGIYHNPIIPCPGGCSVDLDNVEVVAPRPAKARMVVQT
jgi:hypothetical protein